MRALEVSHRFFVYDQYREKGNKAFMKGLYEEAVAYYERALSCFKWLEVLDDPDSSDEDVKKKKKEEKLKKS